jgi:putative tributyrin esterase
MAIAHVNYFNKALEKEVGFYALLPDRQPEPGPYPSFYLLHGLSDDYTAWLRWTSLELYVRELPLIVILPDSDRCFYCDLADGPSYETAIVQDLVGFVDGVFPTIADGSARVIGGLSMGGYGSLKIGLKYPDRFCSVTAHSGVHALFHDKALDDVRPALRKGLPTEDALRENDPFSLAEQISPDDAPAIWIDCGVDDGLLEHNRQIHEHLGKLGIAHEYHEFPGAHNWPYWDEHVQQAIAFHCKALGINT